MSYERVGGTLMTNKENNFPKRRFKNFELSGPWEARFLGELGKINPKGQLPQTFEYVDLESVVGTEMVSHRKVTRDTAPSRAQRLAQSGDLFYQTVRPYQKNNFLATNLNGDYVFSTGYAQLRPIISGYFLLSLVQNDSFVKSVLSRCTGTSYPSISADELSKIQVLVSNDEQELYAIGKLFQKLDRLIILHQHKLDKLKNLKKAYLSEMFPAEGKRVPKRRFPGFEGEWERQKWMDTVNISTEMVDPSSGEFDNMLHIAPGNIESFTGRILDNIKTVKEEHLISGKFRFRAGDIVYGKINPQLGKYFFAKIDGLTSADAYVLNGINGTKQEFLYTILQSKDFFNYSVSVSKRSGMPKINREELNDYSYWRPGEDEQNKIGELFQIIDTLQSLQQQKLDKLNDLKKAYLNELFV
jgi:hypothetical protein